MALELIAGGAISAAFECLLNNLSSVCVSLLRRERDSGFDSLLQKLKTTFICLSTVLDDAEQEEMRNTPVKEWLDELQDAVEDAEDFFDEIEYDALKRKVTNKLKKLFSRFNLTDRKAAMENFLQRLDTLNNQIEALDLRQRVNRIQSVRPPSISMIVESEFFGRDEEMNRLKGMLLSDEIGREKICVIPIVGMGGIGKTTLAQAVYKDDQVSNYFQLKAWVCVSDENDPCKVAKILCEEIAVNRQDYAFESFNVVAEKVQEKLKEKKFLIILDDVWCDEHEFWEKMRVILNVGAQGSKIIVTTRNNNIALFMGTTQLCHLNELHEEACLKLFQKIVSRRPEESIADLDLQKIGQEIVEKCKGLPLAVKALASLLLCTEANHWDEIAKSDVLDLPYGKTDILPALRLSYYYLPSHLKKCFVYCCLFPKDYQFKKDELVTLWMANGLLEHSSGIRNQREMGYGYFKDLVSRSFFQSSNLDSSYFVMHDLMVDLANSVSKKRFIYIEKNKSCKIELTKTRHIRFGGDSPEIFKLISKATYLRTFLPIYPQENHLLKDLVKLKRLRYLSLYMFNDFELPKSIGELIHLRFLDLSHTYVKELPKSFCKLYNLQTLKMDGCDLIKFPPKFYHLINLRYLVICYARLHKLPPLGQLPALDTLEIKGCNAIEKVGGEFYGTTSTPFPSLQTLKFDALSQWEKWSVPEINVESFPKLKSLIISGCEKLRGDLPYLLPSLVELHILQCRMLGSSLPMMPEVSEVRIENCDEVAGFKSSNLDQRCVPAKLTDLHISCCGNFEFLPPHKYESLQELSIKKTPSSSLKFLQIDSFPNLKKLEMENCESFESFSFNGPLNHLSVLKIHNCPNFTNCKLPQLPALQTLEIEECHAIENVGLEFYGTTSTPFSSLESLKFKHLSNWKEWSVPVNIEAFPKLKSLIMNKSSKLCKLPPLGQLPALEILEIEKFDAIEIVGREFYGTTPTPFPSLETLTFSDLSNWKKWEMLEVQVEAFPKLKSLNMYNCEMLEGDLPYLLPSLVKLNICRCPMLGSWLPMMPNVSKVAINGCDKIAGFKSSNESLEELSVFQSSISSFYLFQMDSFPNIKKLEIMNCESLGFFTNVNSPINYLSTLEIHDCPNFNFSPSSNLRCPTLTQLTLSSCSKLRILPEELRNLLSLLQELHIFSCPELESLPKLPDSLRELTIAGCDKLIASRNNWNLGELPNLIRFYFGNYDGEDMVPFLEQGFLPTSLVSLEIVGVRCLKTLDDVGFRQLTSLKELKISSCPNLETLPVIGRPPSFEGSLPPSFESFFMYSCRLLDPKYEWKQGSFYKEIRCIPRPQG